MMRQFLRISGMIWQMRLFCSIGTMNTSTGTICWCSRKFPENQNRNRLPLFFWFADMMKASKTMPQKNGLFCLYKRMKSNGWTIYHRTGKTGHISANIRENDVFIMLTKSKRKQAYFSTKKQAYFVGLFIGLYCAYDFRFHAVVKRFPCFPCFPTGNTI